MAEKKGETAKHHVESEAKKHHVESEGKHRAARKPAEKAQSPEEAKKKLMMVIAVCAAVVVAVVVLAIALYSGAPPASPQPQPVQDGNKLSSLLSDSVDALSAIKHAKVDATITMDMTATTLQGSQSAKSTLNAAALYDVANKRIYLSAKRNDNGVEGVTDEMYLINNTQYAKIAVGEKVIWVKETSLVDAWGAFDVGSITGALGTVNGSAAGTETVNGKLAEKIRIYPDVRSLVSQLMAGQYAQMAAMGATEADMQEVTDMVVKSVKRVNAYIWVDKATSLPIRLEGEALVSVNLEEAMGIAGAGTSEMLMKVVINADYEAAVDVRLPAEAANAMGMEEAYAELMEPYCGNGLCDGNETIADCPPDCGAVDDSDIESDLIELT